MGKPRTGRPPEGLDPCPAQGPRTGPTAVLYPSSPGVRTMRRGPLPPVPAAALPGPPFPPRTRKHGRLLGCLLALLLVLGGCYARSDFEKAQALDTPEAYRQFLKEHPDKKDYVRKAKRRLEELCWREAEKQNTYEAYVEFLEAFPFGKYAAPAERRAEEIRAEELGIHFYRSLPDDFYTWVDGRRLPYRLLVQALNPEKQAARYIERKWYEELDRRNLFLPLDPDKPCPVTPDLTLYVRETVITLCIYPRALVEAEMKVGGETVKTYRVAGDHIEKYLLYEIFKDEALYDARLRPTPGEIRAMEQRFEAARRGLPRPGSLVIEYDVSQQATKADQEMVREFLSFLEDFHPYRGFQAYPRGHPPRHMQPTRLYLGVDTEIHAPYVRIPRRPATRTVDWRGWNSERILQDRDYYFKKMTLDLLELLAEEPSP